MTLQSIRHSVRSDASSLLNRPFVTFVILFGIGGAGWMSTLSFLSVFMRDELGAGVVSTALVFVAMHAVTSTLGLSSGIWIVRFGSKSTYVLGLVGMTAFLAVLGWAADFRWVLAVVPVTGLLIAFHWTGLQSYVIEASPQHVRGLASGVVSFVMVLAPGLVGPVFGALAANAGYRALWMAATALVGSALVLAVLFLPNIKRGAGTMPQGDLGIRSYAGLFRLETVRWSLVVRATTSMSFAVFTILAGPKLVDLGGGVEAVGMIVAVGAIGGGVAQLLVGRLSDLLGRRILLGIAVLFGIASSSLFGASTGVGVLLVAVSLQWFSQSAFQTLLVATAGDISPAGEMGRVMALQASSFSWGFVVGMCVVALMEPYFGGLSFHVAAAVLTLAFVGAFKLPGHAASSSTVVTVQSGTG